LTLPIRFGIGSIDKMNASDFGMSATNLSSDLVFRSSTFDVDLINGSTMLHICTPFMEYSQQQLAYSQRYLAVLRNKYWRQPLPISGLLKQPLTQFDIHDATRFGAH